MLIGVHPQVVHSRHAQGRKWICPDIKLTGLTLYRVYKLPVVEAHGNEIAIVIEVEELGARALRLLARQVGQLVEAVEMIPEGRLAASRRPSLKQSILDRGVACSGEKCREPV